MTSEKRDLRHESWPTSHTWNAESAPTAAFFLHFRSCSLARSKRFYSVRSRRSFATSGWQDKNPTTKVLRTRLSDTTAPGMRFSGTRHVSFILIIQFKSLSHPSHYFASRYQPLLRVTRFRFTGVFTLYPLIDISGTDPFVSALYPSFGLHAVTNHAFTSDKTYYAYISELSVSRKHRKCHFTNFFVRYEKPRGRLRPLRVGNLGWITTGRRTWRLTPMIEPETLANGP